MLYTILILFLSDQVLGYEKPSYDLDQAQIHFQEFKSKYNKSYASETEHEMRFEIFKEKLKNINDLNADVEPPFAVFDINQFSDLTIKEFLDTHTGYKHQENAGGCRQVSDADVTSQEAPEELDWRAKNAVTSVRQQGQCGSCWAFSATGAVEGAYAIKHQELVELSEQQMLDCDPTGNCQSGGFPQSALSTIIQLGGQMSGKSYPYVGRKGACRSNRPAVVAKVTDCAVVKLRNEEMLKEVLVKFGPTSVGLDYTPIEPYKRGILKHCPNRQLSHAVVLVGYGTEQGVPYWILKNSYGQQFGESGYFRLMRGINACGIMDNVSVAVVQ